MQRYSVYQLQCRVQQMLDAAKVPVDVTAVDVNTAITVSFTPRGIEVEMVPPSHSASRAPLASATQVRVTSFLAYHLFFSAHMYYS